MICAASGSAAAASSSSVRVTAFTSSEPPASDMTVAFGEPPGPTSSRSMSSG